MWKCAMCTPQLSPEEKAVLCFTEHFGELA